MAFTCDTYDSTKCYFCQQSSLGVSDKNETNRLMKTLLKVKLNKVCCENEHCPVPSLNPALGLERRVVCALQSAGKITSPLSPSPSPVVVEEQGKAGKLRVPNLKSETGLWDQHMQAPCNKDTDFHNSARIVPMRTLGLKNTGWKRNGTPSSLTEVCSASWQRGQE